MDRIQDALQHLGYVGEKTGQITREYNLKKAEILALIAIAEELKRLNDRYKLDDEDYLRQHIKR